MSDREFWIMIRRALLLFVDAIEKRWKLGEHSNTSTQLISEDDSLGGAIYYSE